MNQSRLISDSASELFPANNYRKSFVVQNEDALITIFIKFESGNSLTVSTTDHTHRLGPLNSIALNYGNDGDVAVQGRWTVIATSGTPRISVFETEDVKR